MKLTKHQLALIEAMNYQKNDVFSYYPRRRTFDILITKGLVQMNNDNTVSLTKQGIDYIKSN